MLYHNWESLYYVISLLLGSYLKATLYYLLKIENFEETDGIHFTKENLPDWDMKYLPTLCLSTYSPTQYRLDQRIIAETKNDITSVS